MSSSLSNIKQVCEEYLSTMYTDENTLRCLTKFLNILKISDKFQKDLFIHLSDKGLNKLLNSVKDSSLDIRTSSLKVILELLNNNEVLQNIFCEKFNFNPIGNVICLNWLPKYLKENIKIDEKIIMEIRNTANNLNTNRNLKYWMWPENVKYNDELFPDPQKYLIGFYYANKNVKIII